ncbi:polyprotein [Colletotrichum camelliae]|nr:polyprotein [Colletotrichum camelliae]
MDPATPAPARGKQQPPATSSQEPASQDARSQASSIIDDFDFAGQRIGVPIPEKARGSVRVELWGKWASFDPETSTSREEADTFIWFFISYYEKKNYLGKKLWWHFREDFASWKEATFMRSSARKDLYNFLQNRGVWIKVDTRPHSARLRELLVDERCYNWTDEEITATCIKSTEFRDRVSNPDFVNDIRTPLAAPPLNSQPREQSSPLVSQQRESPAKTRLATETLANGGFQPRRPTPQEFQPRATPPPDQWPHQDPGEVLSRKLGILSKMYTAERKYSGDLYDVFDSKFLIFRDTCQKVGIGPNDYASAFSVMLRGRAEIFYFRNLADPSHPITFREMAQRTKNHFETQETTQMYLSEWRETTLKSVMSENPSQTKSEALQTLFDKLSLIQQALSYEYQGDKIIRDQLINACRGVPECQFCLYNPAEIYEAVCNQLRNAVGTAVRSAKQQFLTTEEEDEQFWTDRRFNGNGRFQRSGRPPPQRQPPRRGNFERRQSSNRRRKCYVCGKEGCWSTKHPLEERRRGYDLFRKSQYVTDDSQEAYQQFLLEYEGSEFASLEENDPEDDDDLRNYFERQNAEESGDQFHVAYFGETTAVDGKTLITTLGDQAVYHALTRHDPFESPPPSSSTFTIEGRYSETTFHGIMPDTGAAGSSTAGHPQFLALQKEDPSVSLDTSTAGQASIRFGDNDPLTSLGTTVVKTPFGPLYFHVVPANTPFLLCLRDMDQLGIKFDNLTNCLQQGTVRVPVVRKWGHPWMLLSQLERGLAWNHLTDVELRRLHRRFGHPSIDRLYRLLTNSGNDVEREAIEKLTKYCHLCQMNGKRPVRFKFTLRDEYNFNYEVIVDIFYLDSKPVLHIIDAATGFQAARFMPDISAKTTWETFRACWMDVYLGPPDWIVADAGRNFDSTEFKQSARLVGTEVKIVPIEAHNSVGKVERYHAILRRAYEIIRKESPSTPPEVALQSAVKAVNDTAGPQGIVPTLLVFGAYPRTTDDSPPSAEVTERAEAIRKATIEVRNLHAKRKVSNGLAARNGPDVTPLHQLPLNSNVRVWREKSGWEGPFRIIAADGETYKVETPRGIKTFRSTTVKPYYTDPDAVVVLDANPENTPETPDDDEDDAEEPPQEEEPIFDEIIVRGDSPPRRHRGRPRKITTPGDPFEEATKKEIDSLIARGVFEFTQYDEAKYAGIRIFKSRIVNEVKNKTTEPYEKSRLVIQGYADDGKDAILTQALTIQRVSQRLILALAPTLLKDGTHRLWLRDITQAYTQSITRLNRTILAYLPAQIKDNYPPETIMEVIKPLYGIAEAGTHWYATYSNHHREKLQMRTSTYDPCLLLSEETSSDFAMIGMQTDDTLGLSTDAFSTREEDELEKATFTAKGKQTLTTDNPLAFNGGIVTLDDNGLLTLRQKGQGKRLETIDPESPTAQQQYVEQRARGAYIASQKDSLGRGLTFVPLRLETAKLFVFVDGSFANNSDMTSQIGYVLVLANETQVDESFTLTGNILHFSSTKSKRVTRSVLASEVYGMVAGVDMAYAVSETLRLIASHLGKPHIPTVVCTDSYSLYECLVKLGTTKEKRLMIDIIALRQLYERRELCEIRWINGEDNPADAMTKSVANRALERLVSDGKTTIRMEGWVTRA